MKGITIWEKYFIQQFLKTAILFLFCFYSLYILIDYASHTSALSSSHLSIHWSSIARYYTFVFSSRAEILIPLAFMIGCVHTLCMLNIHYELLALRTSGFSLYLLMRPFLVMGLCGVLLMYLNEEFLLPQALTQLRKIENSTKNQKSKHLLPISAHHVILEDESLLIFQDYDVNAHRFFDVYWVESIDSIYRMKYFFPFLTPPKGELVDHLVRQPNGELIQTNAYQEYTFSQMKFHSEALETTLLDPDILSLSDLFQQSMDISAHLNEKESKILTAFYWKLLMPWLCLFAIFAPAPFCISFSRQFPLFLIYVSSFFGIIAFYMLMDAFQIAAKRQLLSPWLAILCPFVLIWSYFGLCFLKMDCQANWKTSFKLKK